MGCDLTRNDASARPARTGREDAARQRLQAGEKAHAGPSPGPDCSCVLGFQPPEARGSKLLRAPPTCGLRRPQRPGSS